MVTIERWLRDLRFFRPRRYFLGRHRRNPVVKLLGRFVERGFDAWNNEDRFMYRNGESWLITQLARHYSGRGGFTVFDVGANEGDWCVEMAQLSGNANIEAFEIAPETIGPLKAAVADFANVQVHAIGLSDEEGEVTIYLNSGSDTTGLFKRPNDKTSKTAAARVVRGDDFVTRQGIDHIHFLKIDVEGAEHLILEGFKAMLTDDRIDVIQFEYGEFNIESRQLLRDFFTRLPGYHIGRLFPAWVEFGPWHKSLENFRPANYIAVSRRLPELQALLS